MFIIAQKQRRVQFSCVNCRTQNFSDRGGGSGDPPAIRSRDFSGDDTKATEPLGSVAFRINAAFYYSFSPALILQIIWVMVPMGQKLHQVRGLNRKFMANPIMVEVSIRL